MKLSKGGREVDCRVSPHKLTHSPLPAMAAKEEEEEVEGVAPEWKGEGMVGEDPKGGMHSREAEGEALPAGAGALGAVVTRQCVRKRREAAGKGAKRRWVGEVEGKRAEPPEEALLLLLLPPCDRGMVMVRDDKSPKVPEAG